MSDEQPAVAATPLPRIGRLTVTEIFLSLRAGWQDYRAAPFFGAFFSGFYVFGGFLLLWLGAGTMAWTLAVSLGFPLIAPFAAVGLYEVSRRLEADEPLIWSEILGVVFREKDRQIPWAGAIIVIYFLFWTFLAHMIFALFMGPSALLHSFDSLAAYMNPTGLAMIGAELVVGGIAAFLLFSLTAVSLPLMLEAEIDFVSAMLHSLRTVRENPVTMLLWAVIIAVLTLVAMLPAFLGLLVVMPLLGHATWHLYRRVLWFDPDAPNAPE